MKQKTQMSSLVNIITVILVVVAIVWGGVKIKSQWTGGNSDTTRQVDKGESEPESTAPEAKATDTPVVEEETETDTPTQGQTDEPDQAREQDKPTAESIEKPQQPFDMRKMWTDLNLTPAEQARLRQGRELAMQKRQSMSPEERQAETARLQAMRTRFEAMSPDEQKQAMQKIMEKVEQWRQSDSIELPELSLD